MFCVRANTDWLAECRSIALLFPRLEIVPVSNSRLLGIPVDEGKQSRGSLASRLAVPGAGGVG